MHIYSHIIQLTHQHWMTIPVKRFKLRHAFSTTSVLHLCVSCLLGLWNVSGVTGLQRPAAIVMPSGQLSQDLSFTLLDGPSQARTTATAPEELLESRFPKTVLSRDANGMTQMTVPYQSTKIVGKYPFPWKCLVWQKEMDLTPWRHKVSSNIPSWDHQNRTRHVT